MPATCPPPPPTPEFPNDWTDSAGHAWAVVLTIGPARALKAAGLDILSPARLNELMSDETLQLDALWHLMKAQAKEAGLQKDAFEAALTAQPTDFPTAAAALMGRLSVFFHGLARYRASGLLAKARARILGLSIPPTTPQELLADLAPRLAENLAAGALAWIETEAQKQPTPG